jgi:hypothetical protein
MVQAEAHDTVGMFNANSTNLFGFYFIFKNKKIRKGLAKYTVVVCDVMVLNF